MEKDIIFVDCFNTVICRNKSPKDVILDWAKALGEKYSVEPVLFFDLFYKFERKIFLSNKFKTGEGEFNFQDIVYNIMNFLEQDNFFDVVNRQDFEKSAFELYYLAEQQSHYLNNYVVNKLKALKKREKKIYIVSDFYCGKDVLSKWLKNLGVLDLFDDIFVSCDFCKSKRTGKLYKHLIKTLHLNKKEILMIGDNLHSDFYKAKMNGIGAERIKSNAVKTSKQTKVKHGVNYLNFNRIFDEYGGNFNYSNYAFPLYLFNKRLAQELAKNNARDVFFMAREGQFLKKLFDYYCEVNSIEINTHYFYVSRNSVLVASLTPLEQEDFYLILRSVLNMNIRRFLLTLNFSREEVDQIAAELQVSIDEKSCHFLESKEFKALKENETFKTLYEEKRLQQKHAFASYLKTFGVDFEKDGMHLVDVGWYGTIQDCIAKYFAGTAETIGYYVGKFENNKIPFSEKIGLFFSTPNNHRYGNHILRHRRLDYEQLCRADHNRVKGYKVVEDKCEIVLGDEVNDNLVFNKLIAPLQNQIYEKFVKICNLDYKHYSLIEPLTLQMFYKMVCKQSKEDFEWLRLTEDCCYDNFARIGYTARKFSDSLRIFAYKTWDLLFKITYYFRIKFLKFKNNKK